MRLIRIAGPVLGDVHVYGSVGSSTPPSSYAHDSEEEAAEDDEAGGGERGSAFGDGEEEEEEGGGLLTMEECLAEFVSYQSVSASEEDFHKEGE